MGCATSVAVDEERAPSAAAPASAAPPQAAAAAASIDSSRTGHAPHMANEVENAGKHAAAPPETRRAAGSSKPSNRKLGAKKRGSDLMRRSCDQMYASNDRMKGSADSAERVLLMHGIITEPLIRVKPKRLMPTTTGSSDSMVMSGMYDNMMRRSSDDGISPRGGMCAADGSFSAGSGGEFAAGLSVAVAAVAANVDDDAAIAAELAIGGDYIDFDGRGGSPAVTPPKESEVSDAEADYADEAELISWMATTWQSIHDGYFTSEDAVAALVAVAEAEAAGEAEAEDEDEDEDESSAYAWATVTHEAMILSGKFTMMQVCAGLEETVVSMREYLLQGADGGRYI